MAVVSAADTRDWISEGRGGSADARGRLFERCRQYLLLVAEHELDRAVRGKLGLSDLVQQTFMDAERGFAQFRGQSDEELRAWLSRILRNRAGRELRRYRRTAKRDLRCERPLPCLTAEGAEPLLLADLETPSRQMVVREEQDRLALAVSRLPAHYQQVIHLRNDERKSFEEIGSLMERSPEAARKLWVRAIEQLREAMGVASTDEESASGPAKRPRG
jgi:RNA polymerase sigma-70 factor (ECF subfamily)